MVGPELVMIRSGIGQNLDPVQIAQSEAKNLNSPDVTSGRVALHQAQE
jgi:hypothetical protein